MKKANLLLGFGGTLSLGASLTHVAIIFGGPDWYRFFGAGEKMAQMAHHNNPMAALITAGIASVLFVWSLYGFSGAGLLPKLPFMRFCLVGISGVYLLRAVMPFVISPYFAHLSPTFVIVSSLIVGIIGLCYAIGTFQIWAKLS